MISFQDIQTLKIVGHALSQLGMSTNVTVPAHLHYEFKSLQPVHW